MARTAKAKPVEEVKEEASVASVVESNSEPNKPSMSEAQMLEMIAKLTAQVEKLTKEKEEVKSTEPQYTGSRMDAPCTIVHMMDCTPSLPTTINVNNVEMAFSRFGERRTLRFADLQNIVSKYREWFERGLFILGEDCKPFENELGIVVEEIPVPLHKYNRLAQLPSEEFQSIVSRMSKAQAIMLAKTWIDRYNAHVSGYDNFEYVRILNKKTDGFMRDFISNLVDTEK